MQAGDAEFPALKDPQGRRCGSLVLVSGILIVQRRATAQTRCHRLAERSSTLHSHLPYADSGKEGAR